MVLVQGVRDGQAGHLGRWLTNQRRLASASVEAIPDRSTSEADSGAPRLDAGASAARAVTDDAGVARRSTLHALPGGHTLPLGRRPQPETYPDARPAQAPPPRRTRHRLAGGARPTGQLYGTWRRRSTWASSGRGRADRYAERGRPGIDPVVFFKLQLVLVLRGPALPAPAGRDRQPEPRPPLVPGLHPGRGFAGPLQLDADPPAPWASRCSSASSSR